MHKDRLIELERPPVSERAVLVRLCLPTDSEVEIEESVEELKQLAWTAGAETLLTIRQFREKPQSGTYIGAGKVEEIRLIVEEMEVDLVIFDADLTASQSAKLEDAFGCKVVDRTQLILDIFAQRAQTREGRMQVELAQLQYLLPRLTGRGSVMRQQGGIGIRGPGEQKLEVDRRLIRERIQRITRELEDVRKARHVQRKQRERQAVGTVSLVGYTNAGKSSLLNALTNAGVLAEDKLFATLDPRVRRLELPSGREVLLADTVGFVRKLPHTLVAAFRATLETVSESDLLLLVVDAAHPARVDQLAAVHEVLGEIDAADIPYFLVYNKADLLSSDDALGLERDAAESVLVSARTGIGLDQLLRKVDAALVSDHARVVLRIPQDRGDLVNRLHERARVLDQRYEENSVIIEAELNQALRKQLAAYEQT